MSTNRQQRPGDPRNRHQSGQTDERQVLPDDRGVSAPVLPDIERSPSLTALMGPPPSEEDLPPGKGPRIVVLDGFVNGPGSVRGHARGDVIWLSDLLGLDMMENDLKGSQAAMRYYVEKGAIRDATLEERGQTKVTFLEGEEQYADALQATVAKTSRLEQENASLKAQITMIQEGKSPEQVARALQNRESAPQVVAGQPEERVGDNAIL